jgi:hypothetical protein
LLAQFSDTPGLKKTIDVKNALSSYLESGDRKYFQVRVRFKSDNAGSAFAGMTNWNTMTLTVQYQSQPVIKSP